MGNKNAENQQIVLNRIESYDASSSENILLFQT